MVLDLRGKGMASWHFDAVCMACATHSFLVARYSEMEKECVYGRPTEGPTG